MDQAFAAHVFERGDRQSDGAPRFDGRGERTHSVAIYREERASNLATGDRTELSGDNSLVFSGKPDQGTPCRSDTAI
jgi:hypothetical protein